MGFFGRKKGSEPKDGFYWNGESEESTEDPTVVEINRLHDSARKFRRVGDKRAEMLMEHHRDQLIHSLYQSPTFHEVVAFDEHGDRWYIWSRDSRRR